MTITTQLSTLKNNNSSDSTFNPTTKSSQNSNIDLPLSKSKNSKSVQNVSDAIHHPVPFFVHFISGGIAGTVGAIITCPLEVVKTRFQSSHYIGNGLQPIPSSLNPFKSIFFHVRGTLDAVKSVYINEGLFALWKGIGATIIGVMPSRAIYFSCYNKFKHTYSDLNGYESSMVHLSAAATAGIITSTITNPIWLVKTRLQLQSNLKKPNLGDFQYRGTLHCLKTVIQKEGFLALYQGLSASYLGVIEGTLQWVIYEKLKKSVTEYKQRHYELLNPKDNMKQSSSSFLSAKKSYRDWLDYFLIAATSKLVACIITYPHEVLRTRLRQGQSPDGSTKYASLIQATKLIYREEGIRAFYGGMTAHLLRVVPNSAIMFFVYEVLLYGFSRTAHLSNE